MQKVNAVLLCIATIIVIIIYLYLFKTIKDREKRSKDIDESYRLINNGIMSGDIKLHVIESGLSLKKDKKNDRSRKKS